MTRTVLQSDIDLAKRLIAAGCYESSIVAWLSWRGLSQEESAKLLQDLCQGREPGPQLLEVPAAPRHHVARRPARALRPHRHRLPWYQIVKKALRCGAAVAASIIVLFCFGYVGVAAVFPAVKEWAALVSYPFPQRARSLSDYGTPMGTASSGSSLLPTSDPSPVPAAELSRRPSPPPAPAVNPPLPRTF
jgi:hypothetical protein